jgi:hypothetical protein
MGGADNDDMEDDEEDVAKSANKSTPFSLISVIVG